MLHQLIWPDRHKTAVAACNFVVYACDGELMRVPPHYLLLLLLLLLQVLC
jgi:hypothetical protein